MLSNMLVQREVRQWGVLFPGEEELTGIEDVERNEGDDDWHGVEAVCSCGDNSTYKRARRKEKTRERRTEERLIVDDFAAPATDELDGTIDRSGKKDDENKA